MRRSIFAGLIAAVLGSMLAWADGINIPFSFPASSCTNQFIRSIAGSTGVGTCATVGTSDLASSLSLTTPTLGVASATSINFGQTALSNYTEGTWTPAITTDATVGTPAYSVQVGSYERIGRVYILRFKLTLSGWTGSPTGNIYLSGIPAANNATTNDFGKCMVTSYTVAGLAALNYGMTGEITASSSLVTVQQNGNAGTSAVTAAQFGTTGTIGGTCIYHV